MNWFNSLDSVVRLQQILSWVGVVSALLAAVCGVLAYYLNNQARSLQARPAEEQVTEGAETPLPQLSQEEADQQPQEEADAEEAGLDEGEAARLRERIEELQSQLEQVGFEAGQDRAEVEQIRSQLAGLRQRNADLEARAEEAEGAAEQAQAALAALQRAEEEQGAIPDDEEEKFMRAMAGKPTGPVDIVAVAGLDDSRRTAEELQALMERAGWRQVQVREAQFQGVPEGLYMVVHSQETMPEYAAALAIGLAIIDLMPMPARVKTNEGKEPGYLGIVVGSR
ncbi:MAG TPA: hypothetical protein VLU25_12360 [Acidobacteriota bacterium]|nr:hypothetical protein [Acidobacteriota bacterium]